MTKYLSEVILALLAAWVVERRFAVLHHVNDRMSGRHRVRTAKRREVVAKLAQQNIHIALKAFDEYIHDKSRDRGQSPLVVTPRMVASFTFPSIKHALEAEEMLAVSERETRFSLDTLQFDEPDPTPIKQLQSFAITSFNNHCEAFYRYAGNAREMHEHRKNLQLVMSQSRVSLSFLDAWSRILANSDGGIVLPKEFPTLCGQIGQIPLAVAERCARAATSATYAHLDELGRGPLPVPHVAVEQAMAVFSNRFLVELSR